MIKKLACVLLGALSIASCFGADDDFTRREIVECTPRGGLPNFFAKLERGADVKIAYLGGSITEQNGWRVKSLDMFKRLYPKANIGEIYAAIGGTGSDFGVLRVQKDVIDDKPDLVFVEFAVNDGFTPPATIRKNMEGIVRQIWNANPHTDICFVYTIVERDVGNMKDGKTNRSSSVMEELADYYGIPSVNFGKAVMDLVKADKIIMKAERGPMTAVAGDVLNTKAGVGADGKIPFAKDGVHPYTDTGHVIYAEALERSLPSIKAASVGKGMRAHSIKRKIVAAAPEKVAAVKLAEMDSLKDIARDVSNKSAWSQYLKFTPGEELTVKFKGTFLCVCFRRGPDSGFFEYSVDGGDFKKIKNFDPYCGWSRRVPITLCEGLKDGMHTVVIRASGEKFDKKSILFKEHHEDFDKNPAKYEPTLTYVSALYIFGDLISVKKTK